MEKNFTKEIEFARGLIRGKIAELVFERMLREEKKHEVIPFGYEHTVPTLAQYQDHVVIKKVMDNISDAPDFALISEDKTRVYLVEVKYQSILNEKELVKQAEKLLTRWDPSWLFVATPESFYCGRCSEIAETGRIYPLPYSWAVKDRQREYLKLMNAFKCDL